MEKAIWKHKQFRMLFSGALFCHLGGKVYELALPLLIYDITRSSEIMGWMRAAEFLPYILLAAVIGVLIDRVDRRVWSQWMIAGQVVCLLASWLAIELSSNPLWVLFPCAFFMMAFNFGYLNARMGMLKHVLPEKLQGAAISSVSSLNSLFQALGPLLSGVIILFSSSHITFLWIALFLCIAWCYLFKMPYEKEVLRTTENENIRTSIVKGWQILQANIPLYHMALAIMVLNTCSMVFSLQAIYYAKTSLAMNAVNIGYMVSAGGIGAILGSLLAVRLRNRFGLGLVLIVTMTIQAVGYLLILFLHHSVMLIFAFFWANFFEIITALLVYTYRQESVKEENLGRVMGITGTIFKLGLPFGLSISGYVISRGGVDLLFIACAVIQISTGLACYLSPMVRVK
ncbi:MFS transporter [Xenorhabdus anantnagensis]|uniref:MFS transporter n=1 Tax=Xenorhabdus anantnagensis TaxID=3025875 RepID=A0ABT5LWX7_9GAMM|nr:MFS transporter [Xenorhabdus anantnagensis]MDC9598810.1 MFS transporter [Xenorhabdus anantnagensis]